MMIMPILGTGAMVIAATGKTGMSFCFMSAPFGGGGGVEAPFSIGRGRSPFAHRRHQFKPATEKGG